MAQTVVLNKDDVIQKVQNPPVNGEHWVLAIDPETLEARIAVRQKDGFVPDVLGHEDLFPLTMALEREDGFIEGGDWLVATTSPARAHDGRYRSYVVRWL